MISTKSSLHKIGCLSRTHKISSCWATTNSLNIWEILDPKNKELPRCIQPTSWSLQHASNFIADGKGTGLLGHWRMWGFIPPHGPHFGGLGNSSNIHEVPPEKTLGFHIATYKELLTLLAEIQACLHYRPLCTLSSDPFNLAYLSPGHFLIGKPLNQLPSADNTNVMQQTFQVVIYCHEWDQIWIFERTFSKYEQTRKTWKSLSAVVMRWH